MTFLLGFFLFKYMVIAGLTEGKGRRKMNREQARAHIKNELENYLQQHGLSTRKPFNCLNPDHVDNTPSMSYDRKRSKVHCFSCGADYDTLDLIGIEYGLTGNDLFLKAYELFNLTVESNIHRSTAQENISAEYQNRAGSEQHTHSDIHTTIYTQAATVDNTAYYRRCQSHINETDYPWRRGLSEEIIVRFMLGYDANYSKATGGAIWQALIIPTGKESYVARNTDQNADKKNRYRKNGKSLIYNRKALQAASKPVFITEGELDALSIITVGGEAVALGSTANTQSFLKLLENQKPTNPLIVALDNDQDGQKTADELAEGLERLSISFYRMNPYGEHKDANAALMADKDALAASIQSAENIEQEAIEAERESYLQTNTYNHLQSFIDGIAASVDTPYIPTGFNKLDGILDGGLYEGLYIFGAISSLGKTTLITQIADQIAEAGTDILIFSIEMARNELIAKSISRHTLMNILDNGGDIRNAKTTRGITTGKRYANYSATERELINSAIKAYGEYAGNIYISEGIGDIGAAQIRETVRKHIFYTGKRPVVVIDYLQILAPHNERMTDKQNTDKAVMELKRISRDYKTPVVAISSFNRANYKEAVTMEAFKESGAVEYSSDILIGIQLKGAGQKDFDSNTSKKKNPREVEAVILKNRNGATGDKIELEYYPLFNYFKEC